MTGDVILWVPGTTDLGELSEAIAAYLDSEKLGLGDVTRTVFAERLGEYLNPGSHPMHLVRDHRDPTIDDRALLQGSPDDDPRVKRFWELQPPAYDAVTTQQRQLEEPRNAEDWSVEKHPSFAFTGADGEDASADLTIIQRLGSVPVVVATAGNAEQLAAALLLHVFPDRAEAAEPFLLVEHRPEQGRFEHVGFADFRVRRDEQAPRVGDVVTRREVVERGEDLERERDLKPELTEAPRRGMRR